MDLQTSTLKEVLHEFRLSTHNKVHFILSSAYRAKQGISKFPTLYAKQRPPHLYQQISSFSTKVYFLNFVNNFLINNAD